MSLDPKKNAFDYDDDEPENRGVYRPLSKNLFIERFRKLKAFYENNELENEESLKRKNKNKFLP